MYLARLKKYGPKLLCVVNLTEDLALAQAAQADREIAAGRYRGPLHGIPWGAKDLFATKGIATTWGAAPFRERVPDHDSAVVERLREAGAVLIAKLSMGELAMGGQWFEGMTKNPWDIEQSSSGSSAGSAAAAAAGLAGFTIGTETLGSITSPSERCGAVGLRPSFGRVSRHGAMALSWTMDKIGPICRSVEDCAIVFEAIRGADPRDRSTIDAAFAWNPGQPLGQLRIGVLRKPFDALADKDKPVYEETLRVLAAAGAKLEDAEFPEFPTNALRLLIEAEGAAAFEPLARTGGFEQLRGQEANNWPNILRSARLVPAAEYINMQRARTLLMQKLDELMSRWDVLVTPPDGDVLRAGNLCGIPEVSVPCGFDENHHPRALRFIGPLFREGAPLRVALAFEQATKWHSMHPPMDFA
jgi:Asp-tRNA(Asn)/Glu-tRNA(Gln) amidotransferase A subunit family amidase